MCENLLLNGNQDLLITYKMNRGRENEWINKNDE